MKRPFLYILVFSVLLIPAREIYAQRAVVIAEILNVRSGPGTKFEVIEKLKKGDSYLVEKIEGSWVQLAWPIEAWVYKGLVKIEEQHASLDELQIDFQNWLLDKYYWIRSIEFKSDWQIWLKLREYPSKKTLRKMAKEIALEYKKKTGYSKRPVVVTIFRRERKYVTGKY
ncbi:MAG: SH3 domain-containing protein [Syntrophobacterales bacterium]|nr:MAG: SH3 domain-containing protein [Syntrophobacterales bacterium]